MGYGFGGFLIVVGLVLAFAVNDAVDDVNLYAVGLIMAGVGVVIVALTAFTLNNQRRSRTVQTTTHPDGSQTVNERRNEIRSTSAERPGRANRPSRTSGP
ncbi:DUF6458 family protein, partial [Nocardioides sp.]|uniref:DUF6458 family protein n=1 Tax=Nocardioides sp. TaxID=35761 RepID=UPI003218FB7F